MEVEILKAALDLARLKKHLARLKKTDLAVAVASTGGYPV
jgi:hypothetical protein